MVRKIIKKQNMKTENKELLMGPKRHHLNRKIFSRNSFIHSCM